MKQFYVYILANEGRMIYTGVTNDLMRRIFEHKNHQADGYTKKYKITKLVYFDYTNDIIEAIAREKQIKGWVRRRKIALIESVNPTWKDLSNEWF